MCNRMMRLKREIPLLVGGLAIDLIYKLAVVLSTVLSSFSILRTNPSWRNRRLLEAWEINTCKSPLNRTLGARGVCFFRSEAAIVSGEAAIVILAREKIQTHDRGSRSKFERNRTRTDIYPIDWVR